MLQRKKNAAYHTFYILQRKVLYGCKHTTGYVLNAFFHNVHALTRLSENRVFHQKQKTIVNTNIPVFRLSAKIQYLSVEQLTKRLQKGTQGFKFHS